MVSSISPHAQTHREALLDISEGPPHSSSAFEDLRLFPPSIKFIFWNEFCERFSFHGLKAILALFLSERLGLSQVRSTEMFHLFTMACYATPILGAVISDSLLVNYQNISSITLILKLINTLTCMPVCFVFNLAGKI
jgi:dipeptide/tripeptide permease